MKKRRGRDSGGPGQKDKPQKRKGIPDKKESAAAAEPSGEELSREDEFLELQENYELGDATGEEVRKRTLIKKEKKNLDGAETGLVIAASSRTWIVEPENPGDSGDFIECVVGGTAVSHNPDESLVAVGDRVKFFRETGEGRDLGTIAEIEARSTKLARRPAGKNIYTEQVLVSNVDQLIILMSAADPYYNKRLIDRYLIAAEKGNLEPVICINKIELMEESFVREDLAVYEEVLGIRLVLVSALEGENLDSLREVLRERISVFSGPSGVGKSTLVNILLGEEVQAVHEVSESTSKGMHTTTSAVMFRLPGGGYIVDTPGIREFGIWQLSKEELPFYFHDFDEFYPGCRFSTCTHTHEPGCAVKKAVEEEEISPDRYESYLHILDTIE